MDMELCHYEEQLRGRELEPTELRGNLYELRAKFIQLERAFVINLQLHRHLQAEFNLVRLENEELRKLNKEVMMGNIEIAAKLTSTTSERDHWKDAFFRQKEIIKRNMIDHDNTIKSVQLECGEVLKATEQTAEKHLQELLDLHNGIQRKVKILEEEADGLRAHQGAYENRVLELANLLETLERFDVNVTSTCRLAAEALRNVAGKGDSFDKSLRELRQLSWTPNNEIKDIGQNSLKAQNSVLKEIVKSFKRRTYLDSKDNVPERDIERTRHSVSKNNKETLENFVTAPDDTFKSYNTPQKDQIVDESTCKVPQISIRKEDTCSCVDNELSTVQSTNVDNGSKICSTLTMSNELGQKPGSNAKNSNTSGNLNMLCMESHFNGISYEEYVIKFSDNQLMKIKHSPTLSASLEQLQMEFTDNEDEYQEKQLDGILIFLKNVNGIIKVTRTGLNCSTQTMRPRISHDFTQTSLLAPQVNRKFMMLNTERRAIDRSLGKLEQTVSTLKSSALGQARNMINKESKCRGNDEFFECMKLLER